MLLRTFFLSVIFLGYMILHVDCRGVLTIRLLNFENKKGRTYDGSCCDQTPQDGATCPDQCDYVMRLIVSGLGRANDHVFLFHRPLKYDANDISFQKEATDMVLTILFDEWPKMGHVKMNAFFYDYDDYDHTTLLVDWFENELKRTVNKGNYQRSVVKGNRQSDKTSLEFEWSVHCFSSNDCLKPPPEWKSWPWDRKEDQTSSGISVLKSTSEKMPTSTLDFSNDVVAHQWNNGEWRMTSIAPDRQVIGDTPAIGSKHIIGDTPAIRFRHIPATGTNTTHVKNRKYESGKELKTKNNSKKSPFTSGGVMRSISHGSSISSHKGRDNSSYSGRRSHPKSGVTGNEAGTQNQIIQSQNRLPVESPRKGTVTQKVESSVVKDMVQVRKKSGWSGNHGNPPFTVPKDKTGWKQKMRHAGSTTTIDIKIPKKSSISQPSRKQKMNPFPTFKTTRRYWKQHSTRSTVQQQTSIKPYVSNVRSLTDPPKVVSAETLSVINKATPKRQFKGTNSKNKNPFSPVTTNGYTSNSITGRGSQYVVTRSRFPKGKEQTRSTKKWMHNTTPPTQQVISQRSTMGSPYKAKTQAPAKTQMPDVHSLKTFSSQTSTVQPGIKRATAISGRQSSSKRKSFSGRLGTRTRFGGDLKSRYDLMNDSTQKAKDDKSNHLTKYSEVTRNQKTDKSPETSKVKTNNKEVIHGKGTKGSEETLIKKDITRGPFQPWARSTSAQWNIKSTLKPAILDSAFKSTKGSNKYQTTIQPSNPLSKMTFTSVKRPVSGDPLIKSPFKPAFPKGPLRKNNEVESRTFVTYQSSSSTYHYRRKFETTPTVTSKSGIANNLKESSKESKSQLSLQNNMVKDLKSAVRDNIRKYVSSIQTPHYENTWNNNKAVTSNHQQAKQVTRKNAKLSSKGTSVKTTPRGPAWTHFTRWWQRPQTTPTLPTLKVIPAGANEGRVFNIVDEYKRRKEHERRRNRNQSPFKKKPQTKEFFNHVSQSEFNPKNGDRTSISANVITAKSREKMRDHKSHGIRTGSSNRHVSAPTKATTINQQIPYTTKTSWINKQVPATTRSTWTNRQMPTTTRGTWTNRRMPATTRARWTNRRMPATTRASWTNRRMPATTRASWTNRRMPATTRASWTNRRMPATTRASWTNRQIPATTRSIRKNHPTQATRRTGRINPPTHATIITAKANYPTEFPESRRGHNTAQDSSQTVMVTHPTHATTRTTQQISHYQSYMTTSFPVTVRGRWNRLKVSSASDMPEIKKSSVTSSTKYHPMTKMRNNVYSRKYTSSYKTSKKSRDEVFSKTSTQFEKGTKRAGWTPYPLHTTQATYLQHLSTSQYRTWTKRKEKSNVSSHYGEKPKPKIQMQPPSTSRPQTTSWRRWKLTTQKSDISKSYMGSEINIDTKGVSKEPYHITRNWEKLKPTTPKISNKLPKVKASLKSNLPLTTKTWHYMTNKKNKGPAKTTNIWEGLMSTRLITSRRTIDMGTLPTQKTPVNGRKLPKLKKWNEILSKTDNLETSNRKKYRIPGKSIVSTYAPPSVTRQLQEHKSSVTKHIDKADKATLGNRRVTQMAPSARSTRWWERQSHQKTTSVSIPSSTTAKYIVKTTRVPKSTRWWQRTNIKSKTKENKGLTSPSPTTGSKHGRTRNIPKPTHWWQGKQMTSSSQGINGMTSPSSTNEKHRGRTTDAPKPTRWWQRKKTTISSQGNKGINIPSTTNEKYHGTTTNAPKPTRWWQRKKTTKKGKEIRSTTSPSSTKEKYHGRTTSVPKPTRWWQRRKTMSNSLESRRMTSPATITETYHGKTKSVLKPTRWWQRKKTTHKGQGNQGISIPSTTNEKYGRTTSVPKPTRWWQRKKTTKKGKEIRSTTSPSSTTEKYHGRTTSVPKPTRWWQRRKTMSNSLENRRMTSPATITETYHGKTTSVPRITRWWQRKKTSSRGQETKFITNPSTATEIYYGRKTNIPKPTRWWQRKKTTNKNQNSKIMTTAMSTTDKYREKTTQIPKPTRWWQRRKTTRHQSQSVSTKRNIQVPSSTPAVAVVTRWWQRKKITTTLSPKDKETTQATRRNISKSNAINLQSTRRWQRRTTQPSASTNLTTRLPNDVKYSKTQSSPHATRSWKRRTPPASSLPTVRTKITRSKSLWNKRTQKPLSGNSKKQTNNLQETSYKKVSEGVAGKTKSGLEHTKMKPVSRGWQRGRVTLRSSTTTSTPQQKLTAATEPVTKWWNRNRGKSSKGIKGESSNLSGHKISSKQYNDVVTTLMTASNSKKKTWNIFEFLPEVLNKIYRGESIPDHVDNKIPITSAAAASKTPSPRLRHQPMTVKSNGIENKYDITTLKTSGSSNNFRTKTSNGPRKTTWLPTTKLYNSKLQNITKKHSNATSFPTTTKVIDTDGKYTIHKKGILNGIRITTTSPRQHKTTIPRHKVKTSIHSSVTSRPNQHTKLVDIMTKSKSGTKQKGITTASSITRKGTVLSKILTTLIKSSTAKPGTFEVKQNKTSKKGNKKSTTEDAMATRMTTANPKITKKHLSTKTTTQTKTEIGQKTKVPLKTHKKSKASSKITPKMKTNLKTTRKAKVVQRTTPKSTIRTKSLNKKQKASTVKAKAPKKVDKNMNKKGKGNKGNKKTKKKIEDMGINIGIKKVEIKKTGDKPKIKIDNKAINKHINLKTSLNRNKDNKKHIKSIRPAPKPTVTAMNTSSDKGPRVLVPNDGLFVPGPGPTKIVKIVTAQKDENGTLREEEVFVAIPANSEAQHIGLQVKRLNIQTVFNRYWPAILGLTIGTAFLVAAVLTSVACRAQRLYIQRYRYNDQPQHLTEPPDTSEYSSSAASLVSDATRSSIRL